MNIVASEECLGERSSHEVILAPTTCIWLRTAVPYGAGISRFEIICGLILMPHASLPS